MSDHKCFRCPECGSCPACAADALDRVIEEAENLRERLDQFEAYGIPNVSVALDRVSAAEAECERLRSALREIADYECGRVDADTMQFRPCRTWASVPREAWCDRCIARAALDAAKDP